MPRCKACGAPVVWQRRMPLNPDGRIHVCLAKRIQREDLDAAVAEIVETAR